MANKYVRHGATYCGDGTSSAEATSDGGVGAWNNLIDVFAGSPAYGSLDNGDIVYVQTNNGSDITVTLSADLTMVSGAVDNPITYIFDDGTTFPVGGILTLELGASYVLTTGDYVNLIGKNLNFIIHTSYAGTSIIYPWLIYSTYFESVKFESDELTSHSGVPLAFQGGYTHHVYARLVNCYLKLGMAYPMEKYAFIAFNSYNYVLMLNPTIDLNGSGTTDRYLFNFGDYGISLHIIGGKVINASDQNYLFTSPPDRLMAIDLLFDGFDPGSLITNIPAYTDPTDSGYKPNLFRIYLTNINDNYYDFVLNNDIGTIEWRSGQNYPTLNAILPDGSNTYWSYKVYPVTVNKGAPMEAPQRNIWYDLSSAVKTVTCEFLANVNYGTPKDDEMWMAVTYRSTDGNTYTETTKGLGNNNVDTSTAGWSATVYGAQSYNKFKISLTTVHQIKQYSDVRVVVFIGMKALSSTDFFFIDPEILLS